MPKCPKCEKEINFLIYKTLITEEAYIDSFGDIDSQEVKREEGKWYCPFCEKQLKVDGQEFLKGK
jgi:phage FluMu protein Com